MAIDKRRASRGPHLASINIDGEGRHTINKMPPVRKGKMMQVDKTNSVEIQYGCH